MILKILKRLIPLSYYHQLLNFITLAKTYGQYQSISVQLPIDANKNPLPWYTYPAIEYLNNLDFSDKSIFEYGCGNSSLYWSSRSKTVTSIEDNLFWFEKINSTHGRANLRVKHAAEKEEYVNALVKSDEKPDVIIVDGVHRDECIDLIISSRHFQKPSMIIFDNSDWHTESCRKLREELDLLQIDFHGFGPMNEITWTTSIFFSRDSHPKPLNNLQPHLSMAGVKAK